MTLEQSILDVVRSLPVEKQTKLLAFLKDLQGGDDRNSRDSGYGLLADFDFGLSAEEIDEARREMWSGFPRDDI